MKKSLAGLFIIAVMVALPFRFAHAITITYEAIDLLDTTTGEDLWEYQYTVSDTTFTADTGFTIYFDLGLYDLLDPFPVSPSSDWWVTTWDPDSNIPDDGAFDALALVDSPTLANTFTVSFVWLGASCEPVNQYFDVYDGITWATLDSGLTISSSPSTVPEPTTMTLFGAGIACLLGVLRRRKSN